MTVSSGARKAASVLRSAAAASPRRPRKTIGAHLGWVGHERRVDGNGLETGGCVERDAVVVSEEQESAQLGNQCRIAAKQEAERLAHVRLNRAHVESLTDEHEKVTGVAGNRHLDSLLESELVEIDGQRAVGLA